MRIAILELIINCPWATLTTGKPRDTESGHAWFGEEGLEKRRVFHGQLADLLLDRTLRLGKGDWKHRSCCALVAYSTGNAPFLPGHIPSRNFLAECTNWSILSPILITFCKTMTHKSQGLTAILGS